MVSNGVEEGFRVVSPETHNLDGVLAASRWKTRQGYRRRLFKHDLDVGFAQDAEGEYALIVADSTMKIHRIVSTGE